MTTVSSAGTNLSQSPLISEAGQLEQAYAKKSGGCQKTGWSQKDSVGPYQGSARTIKMDREQEIENFIDKIKGALQSVNNEEGTPSLFDSPSGLFLLYRLELLVEQERVSLYIKVLREQQAKKIKYSKKTSEKTKANLPKWLLSIGTSVFAIGSGAIQLTSSNFPGMQALSHYTGSDHANSIKALSQILSGCGTAGQSFSLIYDSYRDSSKSTKQARSEFHRDKGSEMQSFFQKSSDDHQKLMQSFEKALEALRQAMRQLHS